MFIESYFIPSSEERQKPFTRQP